MRVKTSRGERASRPHRQVLSHNCAKLWLCVQSCVQPLKQLEIPHTTQLSWGCSMSKPGLNPTLAPADWELRENPVAAMHMLGFGWICHRCLPISGVVRPHLCARCFRLFSRSSQLPAAPIGLPDRRDIGTLCHRATSADALGDRTDFVGGSVDSQLPRILVHAWL